jgi:hypothetical protein
MTLAKMIWDKLDKNLGKDKEWKQEIRKKKKLDIDEILTQSSSEPSKWRIIGYPGKSHIFNDN